MTHLAMFIWLTGLCVGVFGIFGSMRGVLTRKEGRFCIMLMDIAGLIMEILLAFSWLPAWLFVAVFARWVYRDYRRWKNDDDDEDLKKRRRERVRNKLKKFAVKKIQLPRPVTVPGF